MNEVVEIFKSGDKVRLFGNQGFRIGTTGTIGFPPKVDILTSDFGENYFRKAQTLNGETIFVWIIFDEPQYDSDGDGPYAETEINIEYLEIIKS